MKHLFKKGEALFGFFRYTRNKNGEVVLRPVLGRIFAALGGLALLGWLTAALAVMVFVQQARGFQGGAYRDIVFPWRWDHYRVAWGEEFVERGLELLRVGEFQEGLHMVRVGHVKSPSNLEARLALAEFYSIRGRPDLASNLLAEGLAYAPDDVDYLRTTLRSLISNHDDRAVMEIAADLLSGEPILTPAHQMTALAAATANFHRGDYDRAEDFLLRYGLSGNPEGRILLTRLDWERGNKQAALDRLETFSNQLTDQDEVYVLLTRYHRELGNHSRAHNFAVMRQINNPLAAGPRIALLYSHHSTGDALRVNALVEAILRDFSNDPEALLALGEFATYSSDVELSRRIFRAMDAGGFSLHLPAILLTETYLNAGRFREAVTFLDSHSEQDETFRERFAIILDSLHAVAYLGLGNTDAGEMHLTRFLTSRNLRVENFLITSERLIKLKYPTLARRVVAHAHRSDPNNQAALTELIRLDLEAGRTEDLVDNINRLLTMRKPARTLLEESVALLGADQFLFLRQREELLRSIQEVMEGSKGTLLPSHS
jgi:tetratricopeptide (TPR) repeat protein